MPLGIVPWEAIYGALGTIPILKTTETPVHCIALIMSFGVISPLTIHAAIQSIPVPETNLTTILQAAVIMAI